ncbi:MAG: TonB-dependent receptor [Flammeovirgaceae bacterium]
MKINLWLFSLFLCICSSIYGQNSKEKYTLSGYIKEKGSGETLPGTTIYVPTLQTGTTSNSYGFYSITLPQGDYEILYSSVGYQPVKLRVKLTTDVEKDINLEVDVQQLEAVEINAEKLDKVSETAQMSLVKVPVSQIKDIPTLLGEKDVLKTLQLMPGVQSGTEGASGLYVRGGGPDQNLLILDDATVYNAYHLFGFFSVFNGDALKSVELYKGGFPARFGGRLSSVLKMDMKEGNKEEMHGKIGVGLISSSLMLEGPLKKNKSSFLISARRTYIDALVRPFLPPDENVGYYFYDLNAKVNYDFGSKNKLYLSGYFGRDSFSYQYDYGSDRENGGLNWGNATGTLRWNHLFNKKLFANTSLVYSDYTFKIFIEDYFDGDKYELTYTSGIDDLTAKFDLDYLPNPKHAIRTGVSVTYHHFTPYALVEKEETSNLNTSNREALNTFETGIYIEDDFRPTNRLNINMGFRFSHFNHKKKHYFRPEPRLSIGYLLKNDLSLKASYASMNQYIHLLSNSGIGLPTDLWVSSTDQIRPQASQQVALGFAKDFPEKNLALTVEGYYKASRDVIQYKEGATFLFLDEASSATDLDWQNNITTGKAWSYGVEMLLQRKFGKFSGWLGYTLSWTQLQFDELNQGEKFFARYDRRHDISLVGIYKPHERITLAATWVYGTGNNFTIPEGEYQSIRNLPFQSSFFPSTINDYNGRNNFRAESYQRLDLGIQFHKQKKRGMRTWEFSIYNVYDRRNPFFYFIEENDNGDRTVLKRITLFPAIPSVSYKFEF